MLESTASVEKVETVKEFAKDSRTPEQAEVARWVAELKNAEQTFESYHKQIDQIVDRYRDERGDASAGNKPATRVTGGTRRYNALWSMKETLKPLLLAHPPTPYVTRTHDDDDAAARDASLVLQRALTLKADDDTFYDALDEGVDDYVLAGRGITWITYVPEFAVRESDLKTYIDDESDAPEDPFEENAEGEQLKYKTHREDDTGKIFYHEKIEYKTKENCIVESVNNKDYLHGPSTRWRHVPWIARRLPLRRDELIQRFGKKLGSKIPLAANEASSSPRGSQPNTGDFDGMFSRAIVWEIWDRVARKTIWVCPDYPTQVLDKKDDMLRLQDFFPCAKPMFGTMTNDTLIPVPDYTEWQDVALELDDVTHRISLLTDALRVVGVYSEEFGADLKKLLKGTKANDMIPVKNWTIFQDKGGIKGAVDFLPIDVVINTLNKLYEVRQRLVAELYEITGISDIIRGASDPRETAAAQKLKGSFANARLTMRQKCVARHARETLSILAEIICTLYSEETLIKLSSANQIFKLPDGTFDTKRWSAAFALLKDEPMRMLRVKIDTEDLANENLSNDRQEATQFLQGLTQYLQSATVMIQQAPNIGDMLGKLLLFAVRKFRVGRGLEADIDAAIKKLAQTGLGQPQGEGQQADQGMDDKTYQVEMAKIDVLRKQNDIEEQRMQIEGEKVNVSAQKHAADHTVKQKDVGIKAYKAETDAQIKAAQLQVHKQQADAQTGQLMLQAQDQEHTQHLAEHDAALAAEDQAHRQDLERANFTAGRQDADTDTAMRVEEHVAKQNQQQADNVHRQREHMAAQANAAADRQQRDASEKLKLKAATVKQKTLKRPKNK